MLEKKTAKSAAAKRKGNAEAAPMAKAALTKPASRRAAGSPAAVNPREDDMHERIQRRAYELWEREGRPEGREHANWHQAQTEIARTRSQRVGVSR